MAASGTFLLILCRIEEYRELELAMWLLEALARGTLCGYKALIRDAISFSVRTLLGRPIIRRLTVFFIKTPNTKVLINNFLMSIKLPLVTQGLLLLLPLLSPRLMPLVWPTPPLSLMLAMFLMCEIVPRWIVSHGR